MVEARNPPRTLLVKICGLTSEAAVDAAVDAGADRVGFVFARSVRQVTPQRAAELAARLPPDVGRVAVMRRATQDDVDRVLDAFEVGWLQADAVSLSAIALPPEVIPMPVVRDGEAVDPVTLRAMLYEAPVSGGGVRADWQAAARLARQCWLMLAGGLDAGNVSAAVAQVRPAAVDVSSGVESAPGEKDPSRMRAFVGAARAAAHRLVDYNEVPAAAGEE